MKNSTRNWIFAGGAVVGIALILRQFAGGITTNFRGLKWQGLDGLRLRFSMFYDVTNANDIAANISSLTGKIFYGDYRLTDVVIDKPVDIMPGTTEKIEVRFSVSPGLLIGELTKIFEEKSGVKRFALRGWLSGSVGKIPFRTYLNEKLGIAE